MPVSFVRACTQRHGNKCKILVLAKSIHILYVCVTNETMKKGRCARTIQHISKKMQIQPDSMYGTYLQLLIYKCLFAASVVNMCIRARI